MSNKHSRTMPALADVSKDISGPLPFGLLDRWAAGDRSQEAACALLAPFRREGFVVSSDTAGLTKMTQERDLLDVLWLVSEPKQILHAVGTAIGGEAIGVWTADNSEMFYAARLGADAVVDAMVEAQARIAERASVKVGLCIHSGVFYAIGGGLYGGDAQAVELLAETFAHGAEILVTQQLVDRLRAPADYTLERRADLDAIHAAGVFSLRSSRRLASLDEGDRVHPHPFPPEFFAMLRARKCAPGAGGVDIASCGAQERECFVVFLARRASGASQGDLAALLDGLVQNERMTTIVEESVSVPRNLAQLGGGVAVVVFERGDQALEFSRSIRDRFCAENLEVTIGIDHGPVLLFARNASGAGAVAGDAINLSSKISEDLGEPGRIRITERAARSIEGLDGAAAFEETISSVRCRGVIV